MNGKISTFCSLQSPSTVVVGKKRVRNTLLHVWLSPDERAKIQEHMADVGIRNLSAYVRKMALQRRCANNLNQIAVRENINGGVYPDEIKALQKDYADLWGPLSELLERLSEVVAL